MIPVTENSTAPADFDPSKFETLEEAEAYLKSLQAAKETKPEQKVDAGEEKDPEVWRSEHYYLRPGFKLTDVQRDAREAARYNPDSVKVFVHAHMYGEECIKGCKEKV